MRVLKRVGAAYISFLVAVELAGIGWSAIAIFLLHDIDPKWGDELGNLQLAVQLIQYLAVGSGLSFLACFLLLARFWLRTRIWASGLAGFIAGVASYVLGANQFGFWLADLLGLRGPGHLTELMAPGLVTCLLCSLVVLPFQRRRDLHEAVA